MNNQVWFDARSLSRGYTTGWERYVRELVKYLPSLIDLTLWRPNTPNRLTLLLSDYLNQKSQKDHKVLHYPTYPPALVNKSVKTILTVHDLTWWSYPETSSFLGKNYYKKNMEKAIKSANLIITPSKSVKNELLNKFNISFEKISHISHGNSLPPGIIKDSSKPYFLSIGTVEPRKNLDFYSKAIEKSNLLSNFDFYHVGRIGWGKLPANLKQIIAKNDQDLANLIKNAQAVVLCSKYEGYGLPVLESHAQGIPVIMSNVDALKELSNEQDLIFELNNFDSLIQSLKHFSENKIILDEKNLMEAMNATWLKSAQKHVEVYKRLINE